MRRQPENELESVEASNSRKTLAQSIITTSQKGVDKVLRILGTSPDDEVVPLAEFHHRAFKKEVRPRKD